MPDTDVRAAARSASSRRAAATVSAGTRSYFYRDDSLQANTWGREPEHEPAREQRPGPVRLQAVRATLGGPIPVGELKNKLFFFAAQEWVNFFAIQTNTATVPTALMRTGNFSELLDPNNGFFTGARTIIDPTTGQAFPGNIIPTNRLSANGIAHAERVSAADAGIPAGHREPHHVERQPAGPAQGQPPLRLPDEQQGPVQLSLRQVQLGSGRCVSRDLPVRADRLGPAQLHADGELDERDLEHADQ